MSPIRAVLLGCWTTLNGTQETDLYFRVFNPSVVFLLKDVRLGSKTVVILDSVHPGESALSPTSWAKQALSTGSGEGEPGRVHGAGFSHHFVFWTSQHWNQRDDCISEVALIRCQLQWRHDDMGFNGGWLPGIVSCIQAMTCFASSLLLVLRLARLKPAWEMPALSVVSPQTLLGAAIFWRCCAPAAIPACVPGAQSMGRSSSKRPRARSTGKQMLCEMLIRSFVLSCNLQRRGARIKRREPCSARQQLQNYSCSEETT